MNEDVNPSDTWAIEVEGLVKSFGSSRALSGVDIRVKKGDHLTIFGPNGAGKTTLIKLLSTLAKPSGGSARVEGLDISIDPVNVRRRLGVVTHPTFLYSDLTVFENLRFYGKMYRVPDLQRRIGEIVQGRRGITADTALRLGRFFGMDPQFWLNLQNRYDLLRAREKLGSRLEGEVRIHAA